MHYGKCSNIIGVDEESGDEIVCGDMCNPNEQFCHFCVSGFRGTGGF